MQMCTAKLGLFLYVLRPGADKGSESFCPLKVLRAVIQRVLDYHDAHRSRMIDSSCVRDEPNACI